MCGPLRGRSQPNYGMRHLMIKHDLHPSGFVRASLIAHIFDFQFNNKLDLLGTAVVAEVIAADCRFNIWVLEVVKKSKLSEEKWLLLLEEGEKNEGRCKAAMKAYESDHAVENLCCELAAVRDWLNLGSRELTGLKLKA